MKLKVLAEQDANNIHMAFEILKHLQRANRRLGRWGTFAGRREGLFHDLACGGWRQRLRRELELFDIGRRALYGRQAIEHGLSLRLT